MPKTGCVKTGKGMSDWYVYVVRCRDNSLYTGITTDITRRVDEHNNQNKQAANYTRSRRPVKLVYWETCATRSEALSREAGVKQLSKAEKESLVRDAVSVVPE